MEFFKKNKLIIITGSIAALATIGVAALLVNVIGKQQEGKQTVFRVVNLEDTQDDPAVWAKNFPIHYEMYNSTVDQVRTRYGGSEAVPHSPTNADPRSVLTQNKLQEDPYLKTMWLGYPFSVDFREERGHIWANMDQEFTGRQTNFKQPGTCLNCHSSSYAAMMKLGNGDLDKGFHAFNKLPWAEARKLVNHPVSCVDCHNPADMELRITRPALMNGLKALKATQGVKDYDVNKMATRQEMRSYVCAQCHVEYYFKGPEKTLVFLWENGIKAEEILAYFDKVNHKDWIHKITEAPTLKVQHPEYELYSQSTHAKAGVTCTDCHMPYKKVGAQKVHDHHVRSPLLNIDNSCRTCHNVPASELKARVETIQDKHWEIRGIAMKALVELIKDIETQMQAKAPEVKLTAARKHQRNAQFYIDFVEAENSTGFHAPQESLRIFSHALDEVRKGQNALR